MNRSFDELIDTEGLTPAERAKLERMHELLLAAEPPPELSASIAEPPSNVVQFLYPIGFPGTKGPATAWRPLPGLTRAYVGQWWKVSNPWQGNASSVNKRSLPFHERE